MGDDASKAVASEPGDGTLTGALKDARPDSDDVAMEHAEAGIEANLFGVPAQPVNLGPFTNLRRLGRGGMGTVYLADEPELDRQVALKVLAPTLGGAEAQEQLRKEAKSLAQLRHPNVVTVHRVDDIEGRLVMAMEYVEGSTVHEWQESERPWRQVLEVYRKIGAGLAAAHDRGIVHRDVKPQNAVIGDDGRVCVLDFGLARVGMEVEDVEVPQSDDLENLTVSGAIAGTPAYMSPEQFEGKDVGPASDQFSFCVSLYRALYGQRPFAGKTMEELRESVVGGKLRPPPRDRAVPRWVHAAVVRGLSPDPKDRHESIKSLCDVLGRDPARTRRRVAAVVALVALVATTTWLVARGAEASSGGNVCDAGPDRLAAVWNQARRSALADALAAAGPYGASIQEPLIADVEDYGRAYTTMYRGACMAHQRGEQSDELLDKRMDCLGSRLDALDAAVSALLEVDSSTVAHARDVVADLPRVSYCADTAALAAAQPLPEDPAVRTRVTGLRKRLSQANSLEHMRRLGDALDRAKGIASDATKVGYAPIEAEAHLAVGRIYLLQYAYENAVKELQDAEALGLEYGLREVVVEATARRLYSEGMRGESVEVLAAQFELIEPLSRHLRDEGFARALLFNNIGVVYMTKGDPKRARQYFKKAFAEIEDVPDRPIELESVVKNLAMATPDPRRRRTLSALARDHLAAQLGDDHVLTLEFALGYAHHVSNPADALPVVQATCERYGTYHPDQLIYRLHCLSYLGFLQTELGMNEQARRTFEAAARVGPETWALGEKWRDLARGAALLLAQRPRRAIERFERAIETLPVPAKRSWWDGNLEGKARLGLGQSYLALGDVRAAATELKIATERFASLVAKTSNVEYRQLLTRARMDLARSMRARGDLATATSLLDQAEAWYRRTSETAYKHRLSEIESWRR